MTATTRPDRPVLELTGVTLDCADAEEMAQFYGTLLGWAVPADHETRWIPLPNPTGGVALLFQAQEWYQPPIWPEQPGEQTKMMHFEIHVDDMEAAVAYAVEVGARIAPHQPPDRSQDQLRVMLDPAGHPFCLYAD